MSFLVLFSEADELILMKSVLFEALGRIISAVSIILDTKIFSGTLATSDIFRLISKVSFNSYEFGAGDNNCCACKQWALWARVMSRI